MWASPGFTSSFVLTVAFAASVLRPATAAAEDCIFVQSISGWEAVDDDTVIVFTGVNRAYRVELAGYCYGLRSTESIAIDSRDGRLCWPSNSHIMTSYGSRCMVTSVLKMAKKEKKANP